MVDYVSITDKDHPDYRKYHGRYQSGLDISGDVLLPIADLFYGGARALVQNTGAALRAGVGFAGDMLSGEGLSPSTRAAEEYMAKHSYNPTGSSYRARYRARGAELVGTPLVWLDDQFMRAGKKVQDWTGSETAGAVTYGLAPNFIPIRYLFSSLGKLTRGETLDPIKNTLSGAAAQMPIDVRPHGHDWFSRLYKMATEKVTGRGGEGFYSHVPGDRMKSLVEATLQTMRGYIKGEFSPASPYYQAVKKKHGVTAGDLTQIDMSLKRLYKADGTPRNIKPDTRRYHQNLIASQLRKAFSLRIKEGLEVPDQLYEAIKAFHPRMEAIQGPPSVSQLSFLTGKAINPQIAQHLLDGWAENSNIGPNDRSIYTGGENPGKILEPHGHLAAITKKGGGYDMMGRVWAELMSEGKEVNAASLKEIFDPKATKIRWNTAGLQKFDKKGRPIEMKMKKSKRGAPSNDFEAYSKVEGTWGPRRENYKENYVVGVPTKIKDVMVDGEPYILYHTVRLTADQLLAGVPMEVVLNPRTGQSWMLAADEMDLGSGLVRDILERPYNKRFWTVFEGTRYHNSDQLKKAGVPSSTKPKVETKPPFDWDVDVMKPLLEIKRTPPGSLGYIARKTFIPRMVDPQAREEKRKRREKRGILSAY